MSKKNKKKNRNKTQKTLIDRKLYDQIRRMDHQEMTNFYQELYSEAFRAGAEKASSIDTTIHVIDKLKNVPGFGEKTLEKIKKALMEDE